MSPAVHVAVLEVVAEEVDIGAGEKIGPRPLTATLVTLAFAFVARMTRVPGTGRNR